MNAPILPIARRLILGAMTPNTALTEEEFATVERMLADLLAAAETPREERAIMTLHARAAALFDAGDAERRSRDRLLRLRAEPSSWAEK